MMNRQSRIRMTLEQRGRTSRCKASTKGWWCMEWKDSITSARANYCGFQMNSKSKPWRLSANRARKNCFQQNYKPAKVLMIGGNFPKAFSRDRLSPTRCYRFRFLVVRPFWLPQERVREERIGCAIQPRANF